MQRSLSQLQLNSSVPANFQAKGFNKQTQEHEGKFSCNQFASGTSFEYICIVRVHKTT